MKTKFNKTVLAASIAMVITSSAYAVPAKVAGGLNYNVMINNIGQVYGTGNNRFNQIGAAPSKTPSYQPNGSFLMNNDVMYYTPIPVGVEDVKSVSASGYRSAALKKDGTVYFWGIVSNLVQGAPSDSYMTTNPVKVNMDGVIDIAVAGTKMLLLKEGDVKGAGTVYEWDFVSTHDPVQVTGLPVDSITSIAAQQRFGKRGETGTILENLEHFRVLTSSGKVLVWGHNDKGQLGLGDYVDRTEPVQLQVNGDVESIAVGPTLGMVLLTNGNVLQSGSYSVDYRLPGVANLTQIQNAFGIKEIVATNNAGFGLTESGSVMAWGWHNYIGSGGYLRDDYAVTISELGYTAVSMGTGNETFMVEVVDGSLHSIGGNSNGQLGDETKIERHSFPHLTLLDIQEVPVVVSDAELLAQLQVDYTLIVQEKDKLQAQLDSTAAAKVVEVQTLAQTYDEATAKLQAQISGYTVEISNLKASLDQGASALQSCSVNLEASNVELVSTRLANELLVNTPAPVEYITLVKEVEVIKEVQLPPVVQTVYVDVIKEVPTVIQHDNHHENNKGHKEQAKHENNGFGNGDQDAPGKSAEHNNAENSVKGKVKS